MVIAAATHAICATLAATIATTAEIIAAVTAAVTVTAAAAANHKMLNRRAGENPACIF